MTSGSQDTAASLDSEFSAFVGDLARESASIINGYFGSSIRVDTKTDSSPVTEADYRAEEQMRAMIRRRYPNHGIVGEEFGDEKPDADFVWTLDPIDGTISFVSGCPLFGTLIGLLHLGRPVLGAIHQPLLGQLCIGDGNRTELDGRSVRLRSLPDLSKATLLTTDLKYVGEHQSQTGFDRLVSATGLLRTWGDCYGYLLVASGRADIMIDPVMHAWDLIPLIPIIRGSGGIITSWTGGSPIDATSCVATNGLIHEQVISLLNS